MTKLCHILVLALCALLATWSAEATLMHKRSLARSQRSKDAKMATAEDDDDDGDEESDADDQGIAQSVAVQDQQMKAQKEEAEKEKAEQEKAEKEKAKAASVADQEQDEEDDNSDARLPPVEEAGRTKKAVTSLAQLDQAPTYPIDAPKAQTPAGLQPKAQPISTKQDKAETTDADAALAANAAEQQEIAKKIAYYEDESVSNPEIEAYQVNVTNETESPAMAGMLAGMWKEMRTFDTPFYLEHLKEEQKKLEVEEDRLKGVQTKEAEEEDENDEDKEKAEVKEEPTPAPVTPVTEVQGEDPAVAEARGWANGNFWLMSDKKQESFLAGACVYLIGGLLVAYLHKQALERCPPDVFHAAARSDVMRNSKDFSFGILDCLAAPNICVLGCCCPCLQWADTMDRHHFLSYWRAFLPFFLLTVLYGFTWGIAPFLVICMGVYYRQKMRQTYNIESGTTRTLLQDCCYWCICQPCAIIQEAREESILLVQNP